MGRPLRPVGENLGEPIGVGNNHSCSLDFDAPEFVMAQVLGIAQPWIWGFRIFQFWGRWTPGFRRPRSASTERSGGRLGKKRHYVEEQHPQKKSHERNPTYSIPRDVKSFAQPAISLELSAHNSAAQEMLFAALELSRELCTCSPDIMG